MAYIPTIQAVTELDAVNALLVSGGEAPVTDLVQDRVDIQTAILYLAEASREVQQEGWSFNTEVGMAIYPTATITVSEVLGGPVTVLNVFVPPAGLMSYKATVNADQQGNRFVDLGDRPSRQWGNGARVFYDRAKNRDGWADRSVLYIDPLWLWDFNRLPQAARSLIVCRARRSYLLEVVNDPANANHPKYERQENGALRHLKREYGVRDVFNVFNNYAVRKHMGARMQILGGLDDPRIAPAPISLTYTGNPTDPGDSLIGVPGGGIWGGGAQPNDPDDPGNGGSGGTSTGAVVSMTINPSTLTLSPTLASGVVVAVTMSAAVAALSPPGVGSVSSVTMDAPTISLTPP